MARPPHKMLQQYKHEGITLCGFSFPQEAVDAVKDFDLTGDILIASYCKTGTSWMQELLWLVTSEGDFDSASKSLVDERVPFIELKIEGRPSVMDLISGMPHPRLLKTHLPTTFFKKQLVNIKFKILLLMRNPKDTLVSFYHFYRMCGPFGNFSGEWNDFFEELVRTKNLHGGDYFEWFSGWLQFKDHPNVMLIHYEDMKADLKSVVQEVAQFLGKDLSDELIVKIVEHLSYNKMKANPMTNYSTFPGFDFNISPFMRKGVVGDWKNYFTPQQNEYIDKQYKTFLEPTGVKHGLIIEAVAL